MNVLIVEDEKPAADKLVRLLKETKEQINVVDVLTSVEKTAKWFLNKIPVDLIFMDIELEDGNCFEIFEICSVQTPVIFTTAYDEYTLKAFKVNSVDYLLKPIASEELEKAIEKYKTIHLKNEIGKDLLAIIDQMKPKKKERFLVKIGDRLKSIQIADVICFYIEERCTFLMTSSGKNYPLDFSLDKLEQMIDPGVFFRVNRNVIVCAESIRDIVSYSSSRLKLTIAHWKESEPLIVSRERVAEFKQWMDR